MRDGHLSISDVDGSQDRLDGLRVGRAGFDVHGDVNDERGGLLPFLGVGLGLHPDLRQLLGVPLELLHNILLVDVVEDAGAQGITLYVHHGGGTVPAHTHTETHTDTHTHTYTHTQRHTHTHTHTHTQTHTDNALFSWGCVKPCY